MLFIFDNFPNHWEISRFFPIIFPERFISMIFSWITKKSSSQKINTSKFEIKFFKWNSWSERRNLFIVIKGHITMKRRNKRFIWTFVNVDYIHIALYQFHECYWIILSNHLKLNFIETSSEQAEMVNNDVIVLGIIFGIIIVSFNSFLFSRSFEIS